MTPRSRKQLSLLIGTVISIVVLWYLFRDIEFSRLVGTLKKANYYWLIPNILLVVFAMHQRAYRWRYMLLPIKRVPYAKLLAATCVGFMANNVLPLRLGEFVRAYSLSSQESDVSKSASLATIFVERMIFDLVALLVILGGVMIFGSIAVGDELRTGILIAVSAAAVGLVVVLLLAKKPEQIGNFLSCYLFFLPERLRTRVKQLVMRFARGLEFFTKARIASFVGLQTIVLWLLMGLSNYFVFLAFDFFGLDIPLDASFFLLVVVSVFILVPSSPGFVGVFHGGTVFALGQYGVGKAEALSFALVLHAAQYIPITLMGVYYLKKEHLSFRKLEQEATE